MSQPNHSPVHATPPTPFPAQARTFPTPFKPDAELYNDPWQSGWPVTVGTEFISGRHSREHSPSGHSACGPCERTSGARVFLGEGYHSTLPQGASFSPTSYSSKSPTTSTPHAPDAPPSSPPSHNQQYSAGLRNFVQGLRRSNMTDRNSSGGSTSLGARTTPDTTSIIRCASRR